MTPLGVPRAALPVAARSSCVFLQNTHFGSPLGCLVLRVLRHRIVFRAQRTLRAGVSAGLGRQQLPPGLRTVRRHAARRALLPLMTDGVYSPEAFDKIFYRLCARCPHLVSGFANCGVGRLGCVFPQLASPSRSYVRPRVARRTPVTRRRIHQRRPGVTRGLAKRCRTEPTPVTRRPSRATRRRNARAARWLAFCNRRPAAAADVPNVTAPSETTPTAPLHRPWASCPLLRGDANIARAGAGLVVCFVLWVMCGCLPAPVGTEQLLFDILCWGALLDPFRCGRRLFHIRAHGSFGFSLDPRWDQTPDINIMHV